MRAVIDASDCLNTELSQNPSDSYFLHIPYRSSPSPIFSKSHIEKAHPHVLLILCRKSPPILPTLSKQSNIKSSNRLYLDIDSSKRAFCPMLTTLLCACHSKCTSC
ncbi:hypothetical protein RRG08_026102 [Elysia crispata]|uniref:Uncharacterized protein n=1 Tax=Elysia crispata TaxID=231223 RepID=A0AAE0YT47_9GAST|nr:hypothetical protein RRG08_026102 [Elysia crispata]